MSDYLNNITVEAERSRSRWYYSLKCVTKTEGFPRIYYRHNIARKKIKPFTRLMKYRDRAYYGN